MPSVTFSGLKKATTTSNHLYTDVHLDFSNPVVRDVAADYDQDAVSNSITNLFNTIPGQNLLNPQYGLNLMQYVFSPATDTTARLIGKKIMENLTVYEPRVKVQSISIEVDSDAQTFTITLSIIIPSLNAYIKIPGTLGKTGFTLLK